MNISSEGKYPSNKLSNFSANKFELDGITISSMEGFLQSLKTKNPDMQKHICSMVGLGAKKAGANKNWKRKQTLYWQGKEYKRDSKEYQELLDKAYMTLYKQSDNFRKALNSTTGTLTHSIGKNKKSETILTVQEFCGRLTKLRDNNGIL